MAVTTLVKERPILMSGPMVKAILDGRKTQTRRIVKKTFPSLSSSTGYSIRLNRNRSIETDERALPFCPYGQPGDRLWVRETFLPCIRTGHEGRIPIGEATYVCFRDGSQKFRKNGNYYQEPPHNGSLNWPSCAVWRPSIHMPRWASRITLEITDVRVEHLQDISVEDVQAEGCTGSPFGPIGDRILFPTLWDQIHSEGSWAANPWVWCISFKRLESTKN